MLRLYIKRHPNDEQTLTMPSLKENGKRLNGKGSHWINDNLRLAIYIRDHFTCQYCGTFLGESHPRNVTLDHLKPQCLGGTHTPRNLVTACLSCNSRRQHKRWTVYAPPGARDRILRTIRRTPNVRLARAIRNGTISRVALVAEMASYAPEPTNG